MPAINRFFTPSAAGYQSQFVPKTLPVDLMAKTLYSTQAKADEMMAVSQTLGEWTQKALEGRDVRYVKELQSEAQALATEAMSVDRTSPEFMRKYLALNNKIKNDPNLKVISAAVAKDEEFWAREKALREKGTNTDWMKADYMRRRNIYTSEDGKGFEGDTKLGESMTLEGNDMWKAQTQYFSVLKASGSEVVKFLGSGISYKDAWEGISKGRIGEQFNATYGDFKDTAAGREAFVKSLYEQGLTTSEYQALSPEDKEKAFNAADKNMRKEFLEVGMSFVHSSTKTGRAEALETERKEAKEAAKEAIPLIFTSSDTDLDKVTGASRDKLIKDLSKEKAELEKELRLATKDGSLSKSQRQAKEEHLALLSDRLSFTKKAHTEAWKSSVKAVMDKVDPKDRGVLLTGQRELVSLANTPGIPSYLRSKLLEYSKVDMTDPVKASKIMQNNLKGIDKLLKDYRTTDGAVTINSGVLLNANKAAKDMAAVANKYGDKVQNLWNEKWYSQKAEGATVASQQVTAPVGEKSVMRQINQSVTGNPNGFKYIDQETGKELEKGMHGGRIVSFNGETFSVGNVVGEGNFGATGKMVFKKKVINANGEHAQDKSGKFLYEDAVRVVTAIPQGANTAFNRSVVEKEYAKQAEIHAGKGDIENAKVATQVARSYRMSDIQEELNAWSQNPRSPSHHTSTRVPNKKGGSTLVNVEVIKAGKHYKVVFGGSKANTYEADNLSQVYEFIDLSGQ